MADSKTPREWRKARLERTQAAFAEIDGMDVDPVERLALYRQADQRLTEECFREAMAQARREEREACASEAVPAADVIGALPNSSICNALAYMAERIRARGADTAAKMKASEAPTGRLRGLYGVAVQAGSDEAIRWPLGLRVRAYGETWTVIGWSASGLECAVTGLWLTEGWPAWSTDMRRASFDDIEED